MSGASRQEEQRGGQRSAEDQGRRQEPGAAPPGLIVWVVTRKIEHSDRELLGVRGSEQDAAKLIDHDIEAENFPSGMVVRYYSESQSII